MIQAFQEVLKDLWHFTFATSEYSDNSVSSTSKSKSSSAQASKTVNRVENSLAGVIVPARKETQTLGRVAYVQADTAICLSSPKFLFDTRVGSLFYGDEVVVIRMQGAFAEIETSKIRGWIEAKVLSDNVQQVFPSLQSGQTYGFNNEQTVKLRSLIQDETLAQLLMLPLQSTEYVLYLLKRTGIEVVWPQIRPREPGFWHNILRGVKRVTISIEPRTSSIFEHASDDTLGFLGYVEAVHPDLSITLSTVGRVNEGEYLVEEFTHEEWKEWRPVFISFT